MNIIGRLTRDAEVRTTSNDKQVVNFSIATNESYRNKQGERIEQTTYFDCSYWLTPNVAKFLTKGKLVELSGRISARGWIGSDGIPKSGLNFNASQIKLHGNSQTVAIAQPILKPLPLTSEEQGTVDDLPF